jgi:hypothetical protein
MTTFFLPIKSVNLAHYFMKGCVCPTLYISNRNEDIQSKFPDNLLFTTEQFTDDTDCALEIVLTKNEAQCLQRYSSDFHLFSTPLPISRVKKVIFLGQENCDNTCFNIESGAAFLPQELIHVEPKLLDSSKVIKAIQLINENENENKLWHSEIDRFNRILGGFAIMQTTSSEFADYPINYLFSLSLFNKKISNDFKKLKLKSSNDYRWIFEMDGDKSQFRQFRKLIYNKIESDIIEAAAMHDNVDLKKSIGKYDLEEIDQSTNTYTLAILASYDVIGARMTLDNFISDLLANKFPFKKKEPLALTFGINKGYSAFRNSYKTKNFDIDIKFKLDSQLDYYTIESIYQFVFNDKSDNESFDYIDNWCPRFKSNDKYEGYETGFILDKEIRFKKKEAKKLFFKNFFQNTFRDEIYKTISTEIAKWSPPYLSYNGVAGIDYFRQLLETHFEKYTADLYDYVKVSIETDSNDKLMQIQNEVDELQITLNLQQKEISELKRENEKLKKVEQNKKTPCNTVTNEQYTLKRENYSTSRIMRSNELIKKRVKELKVLAANIGVASSKLNKDDLIKKILESEFN